MAGADGSSIGTSPELDYSSTFFTGG